MAWLSASEPLRLWIELLIKSTAVLSAAILLALLLRKRSASLRHFVLTFFLAGLLLLPALTPVRFGWETGLLPALSRDAASPRNEGGDLAGGIRDRGDGVLHEPDIKAGAKSPRLERARNGAERSAAFPDSDSKSNGAGFEGGGPAPLLTSSPDAARRILETFSPLLWLAGLSFLLLRLGAGLHGAYRLTKEGEPVHDPAWRILLDRLLALLGLRRNVRLKSHDDVAVPLTWGLVRPVILIPGGHEGWTEGQRSSALLHELSHIKRADFLVMMLVRLSLAVFWWNPLAWLAFGMLKKEQEKACDELVLRTGLKPSTYAANLLLLRNAAGFRWDPSAALLGMFGRSSLNERLAAILRQKLILKEVGMKTKIMLGIAAVLAVAVIGVARPETSPAAAAEVNVSTLTGPAALGLVEDPVPAETADRSAEEAVVKAAPGETAEAEARGEDIALTQEKEKQEKERQEYETQEKETQEKEKALKIVITAKDGKKVPLEITIDSGDEKKTITVDAEITLKKGAGGELILVGPEGKEIEVLKGDPVRLMIKEGDIKVVEGGKALKIVEGGALKLVTEKDKGQIALSVTKDKGGKEVTYHLVPKSDVKSGVVYYIGEDVGKKAHITIGTGKEGKEVVWVGKADVKPHAFVVTKVDAAPHITIVGKGEAKPHFTVETVTDVKPRIAWTLNEDEEELQKMLEELRAKLEKVKAKELDIAELEKALDRMEEELKAREETLKTVAFRVGEKPGIFSVVRKSGGEKGEAGIWISEGEAVRPVTITTGKKGDFSMAIAAGAHELSREDYERIVESVKKELPGGYEIESEFESGGGEKPGVITLKIKGPDDKSGVPVELAKKLAEALREAIKKKDSALAAASR